jgi:drug/metabolite transporter (DMT)-like permease
MWSLDGFAKALRRLPPVARGCLWMVLATTLLGVMNVIVRYLSREVHPFEIAFFRNLGQLVFMLPWLARAGLEAMRTDRLGMQAARAAAALGGMLLWFSTLALIPVAEATALSFTAPLFATIGAALVLGEVVRLRRWTATTIGFAGALLILRPGAGEFSWSALLALGAAAMFAVSALTLKSVSRTESPNATVLYTALFMTPASLVPAAFVWRWPGLDSLLWLAALGLVATLAHQSLTRAYAAADASAVAPFDFFRLPAAAAIAYVAFGEAPDAWTWIGAAVIFAATAYIARREARLAAAEPGARGSAALGASTVQRP